MQLLTYFIFLFFLRLFWIIPFKVLYKISDFLRFLFYHVIHYRRKIILQNLKNSFPNKKESDFKKMLKKIYGNLMDIVVESLKGLTMTSKNVIRRYKIMNPELIDEYFEKGQSVICVAAHYCNWEWGAFAGAHQLKHKIVAFYKPLSNKYIDQFMRKKRETAKVTMASIYDTSTTFEEFNNEVSAYVMVADQNPTNIDRAIWLEFMNQDTACLHGPEKHARNNNYPVIYLDIQREERGVYTVEASVIANDIDNYAKGEITKLYMNKLESVIHTEPENWLWSHKRWKHQRNFPS